MKLGVLITLLEYTRCTTMNLSEVGCVGMKINLNDTSNFADWVSVNSSVFFFVAAEFWKFHLFHLLLYRVKTKFKKKQIKWSKEQWDNGFPEFLPIEHKTFLKNIKKSYIEVDINNTELNTHWNSFPSSKYNDIKIFNVFREWISSLIY